MERQMERPPLVENIIIREQGGTDRFPVEPPNRKRRFIFYFIDKDFSVQHSRNFISHIKTSISATNQILRKSPYFIRKLRSRILSWNNFNVTIAKGRMKYPAGKGLERLLIRYVELELEALNDRRNSCEVHKRTVEARILRLLTMIYTNFCENYSKIPEQNKKREVWRLVWKVLKNVKDELNHSTEQMKRVVLRKLDLIEEVESPSGPITRAKPDKTEQEIRDLLNPTDYFTDSEDGQDESSDDELPFDYERLGIPRPPKPTRRSPKINPEEDFFCQPKVDSDGENEIDCFSFDIEFMPDSTEDTPFDQQISDQPENNQEESIIEISDDESYTDNTQSSCENSLALTSNNGLDVVGNEGQATSSPQSSFEKIAKFLEARSCENSLALTSNNGLDIVRNGEQATSSPQSSSEKVTKSLDARSCENSSGLTSNNGLNIVRNGVQATISPQRSLEKVTKSLEAHSCENNLGLTSNNGLDIVINGGQVTSRPQSSLEKVTKYLETLSPCENVWASSTIKDTVKKGPEARQNATKISEPQDLKQNDKTFKEVRRNVEKLKEVEVDALKTENLGTLTVSKEGMPPKRQVVNVTDNKSSKIRASTSSLKCGDSISLLSDEEDDILIMSDDEAEVNLKVKEEPEYNSFDGGSDGSSGNSGDKSVRGSMVDNIGVKKTNICNGRTKNDVNNGSILINGSFIDLSLDDECDQQDQLCAIKTEIDNETALTHDFVEDRLLKELENIKECERKYDKVVSEHYSKELLSNQSVSDSDANNLKNEVIDAQMSQEVPVECVESKEVDVSSEETSLLITESMNNSFVTGNLMPVVNQLHSVQLQEPIDTADLSLDDTGAKKYNVCKSESVITSDEIVSENEAKLADKGLNIDGVEIIKTCKTSISENVSQIESQKLLEMNETESQKLLEINEKVDSTQTDTEPVVNQIRAQTVIKNKSESSSNTDLQSADLVEDLNTPKCDLSVNESTESNSNTAVDVGRILEENIDTLIAQIQAKTTNKKDVSDSEAEHHMLTSVICQDRDEIFLEEENETENEEVQVEIAQKVENTTNVALLESTTQSIAKTTSKTDVLDSEADHDMLTSVSCQTRDEVFVEEENETKNKKARDILTSVGWQNRDEISLEEYNETKNEKVQVEIAQKVENTTNVALLESTTQNIAKTTSKTDVLDNEAKHDMLTSVNCQTRDEIFIEENETKNEKARDLLTLVGCQNRDAISLEEDNETKNEKVQVEISQKVENTTNVVLLESTTQNIAKTTSKTDVSDSEAEHDMLTSVNCQNRDEIFVEEENETKHEKVRDVLTSVSCQNRDELFVEEENETKNEKVEVEIAQKVENTTNVALLENTSQNIAKTTSKTDVSDSEAEHDIFTSVSCQNCDEIFVEEENETKHEKVRDLLTSVGCQNRDATSLEENNETKNEKVQVEIAQKVENTTNVALLESTTQNIANTTSKTDVSDNETEHDVLTSISCQNRDEIFVEEENETKHEKVRDVLTSVSCRNRDELFVEEENETKNEKVQVEIAEKVENTTNIVLGGSTTSEKCPECPQKIDNVYEKTRKQSQSLIANQVKFSEVQTELTQSISETSVVLQGETSEETIDHDRCDTSDDAFTSSLNLITKKHLHPVVNEVQFTELQTEISKVIEETVKTETDPQIYAAVEGTSESSYSKKPIGCQGNEENIIESENITIESNSDMVTFKACFTKERTASEPDTFETLVEKIDINDKKRNVEAGPSSCENVLQIENSKIVACNNVVVESPNIIKYFTREKVGEQESSTTSQTDIIGENSFQPQKSEVYFDDHCIDLKANRHEQTSYLTEEIADLGKPTLFESDKNLLQTEPSDTQINSRHDQPFVTALVVTDQESVTLPKSSAGISESLTSTKKSDVELKVSDESGNAYNSHFEHECHKAMLHQDLASKEGTCNDNVASENCVFTGDITEKQETLTQNVQLTNFEGYDLGATQNQNPPRFGHTVYNIVGSEANIPKIPKAKVAELAKIGTVITKATDPRGQVFVHNDLAISSNKEPEAVAKSNLLLLANQSAVKEKIPVEITQSFSPADFTISSSITYTPKNNICDRVITAHNEDSSDSDIEGQLSIAEDVEQKDVIEIKTSKEVDKKRRGRPRKSTNQTQQNTPLDLSQKKNFLIDSILKGSTSAATDSTFTSSQVLTSNINEKFKSLVPSGALKKSSRESEKQKNTRKSSRPTKFSIKQHTADSIQEKSIFKNSTVVAEALKSFSTTAKSEETRIVSPEKNVNTSFMIRDLTLTKRTQSSSESVKKEVCGVKLVSNELTYSTDSSYIQDLNKNPRVEIVRYGTPLTTDLKNNAKLPEFTVVSDVTVPTVPFSIVQKTQPPDEEYSKESTTLTTVLENNDKLPELTIVSDVPVPFSLVQKTQSPDEEYPKESTTLTTDLENNDKLPELTIVSDVPVPFSLVQKIQPPYEKYSKESTPLTTDLKNTYKLPEFTIVSDVPVPFSLVQKTQPPDEEDSKENQTTETIQNVSCEIKSVADNSQPNEKQATKGETLPSLRTKAARKSFSSTSNLYIRVEKLNDLKGNVSAFDEFATGNELEDSVNDNSDDDKPLIRRICTQKSNIKKGGNENNDLSNQFVIESLKTYPNIEIDICPDVSLRRDIQKNVINKIATRRGSETKVEVKTEKEIPKDRTSAKQMRLRPNGNNNKRSNGRCSGNTTKQIRSKPDLKNLEKSTQVSSCKSDVKIIASKKDVSCAIKSTRQYPTRSIDREHDEIEIKTIKKPVPNVTKTSVEVEAVTTRLRARSVSIENEKFVKEQTCVTTALQQNKSPEGLSDTPKVSTVSGVKQHITPKEKAKREYQQIVSNNENRQPISTIIKKVGTVPTILPPKLRRKSQTSNFKSSATSTEGLSSAVTEQLSTNFTTSSVSEELSTNNTLFTNCKNLVAPTVEKLKKIVESGNRNSCNITEEKSEVKKHTRKKSHSTEGDAVEKPSQIKENITVTRTPTKLTEDVLRKNRGIKRKQQSKVNKQKLGRKDTRQSYKESNSEELSMNDTEVVNTKSEPVTVRPRTRKPLAKSEREESKDVTPKKVNLRSPKTTTPKRTVVTRRQLFTAKNDPEVRPLKEVPSYKCSLVIADLPLETQKVLRSKENLQKNCNVQSVPVMLSKASAEEKTSDNSLKGVKKKIPENVEYIKDTVHDGVSNVFNHQKRALKEAVVIHSIHDFKSGENVNVVETHGSADAHSLGNTDSDKATMQNNLSEDFNDQKSNVTQDDNREGLPEFEASENLYFEVCVVKNVEETFVKAAADIESYEHPLELENVEVNIEICSTAETPMVEVNNQKEVSYKEVQKTDIEDHKPLLRKGGAIESGEEKIVKESLDESRKSNTDINVKQNLVGSEKNDFDIDNEPNHCEKVENDVAKQSEGKEFSVDKIDEKTEIHISPVEARVKQSAVEVSKRVGNEPVHMESKVKHDISFYLKTNVEKDGLLNEKESGEHLELEYSNENTQEQDHETTVKQQNVSRMDNNELEKIDNHLPYQSVIEDITTITNTEGNRGFTPKSSVDEIIVKRPNQLKHLETVDTLSTTCDDNLLTDNFDSKQITQTIETNDAEKRTEPEVQQGEVATINSEISIDSKSTKFLEEGSVSISLTKESKLGGGETAEVGSFQNVDKNVDVQASLEAFSDNVKLEPDQDFELRIASRENSLDGNYDIESILEETNNKKDNVENVPLEKKSDADVEEFKVSTSQESIITICSDESDIFPTVSEENVAEKDAIDSEDSYKQSEKSILRGSDVQNNLECNEKVVVVEERDIKNPEVIELGVNEDIHQSLITDNVHVNETVEEVNNIDAVEEPISEVKHLEAVKINSKVVWSSSQPNNVEANASVCVEPNISIESNSLVNSTFSTNNETSDATLEHLGVTDVKDTREKINTDELNVGKNLFGITDTVDENITDFTLKEHGVVTECLIEEKQTTALVEISDNHQSVSDYKVQSQTEASSKFSNIPKPLEESGEHMPETDLKNEQLNSDLSKQNDNSEIVANQTVSYFPKDGVENAVLGSDVEKVSPAPRSTLSRRKGASQRIEATFDRYLSLKSDGDSSCDGGTVTSAVINQNQESTVGIESDKPLQQDSASFQNEFLLDTSAVKLERGDSPEKSNKVVEETFVEKERDEHSDSKVTEKEETLVEKESGNLEYSESKITNNQRLKSSLRFGTATNSKNRSSNRRKYVSKKKLRTSVSGAVLTEQSAVINQLCAEKKSTKFNKMTLKQSEEELTIGPVESKDIKSDVLLTISEAGDPVESKDIQSDVLLTISEESMPVKYALDNNENGKCILRVIDDEKSLEGNELDVIEEEKYIGNLAAVVPKTTGPYINNDTCKHVSLDTVERSEIYKETVEVPRLEPEKRSNEILPPSPSANVGVNNNISVETNVFIETTSVINKTLITHNETTDTALENVNDADLKGNRAQVETIELESAIVSVSEKIKGTADAYLSPKSHEASSAYISNASDSAPAQNHTDEFLPKAESFLNSFGNYHSIVKNPAKKKNIKLPKSNKMAAKQSEEEKEKFTIDSSIYEGTNEKDIIEEEKNIGNLAAAVPRTTAPCANDDIGKHVSPDTEIIKEIVELPRLELEKNANEILPPSSPSTNVGVDVNISVKTNVSTETHNKTSDAVLQNVNDSYISNESDSAGVQNKTDDFLQEAESFLDSLRNYDNIVTDVAVTKKKNIKLLKSNKEENEEYTTGSSIYKETKSSVLSATSEQSVVEKNRLNIGAVCKGEEECLAVSTTGGEMFLSPLIKTETLGVKMTEEEHSDGTEAVKINSESASTIHFEGIFPNHCSSANQCQPFEINQSSCVDVTVLKKKLRNKISDTPLKSKSSVVSSSDVRNKTDVKRSKSDNRTLTDRKPMGKDVTIDTCQEMSTDSNTHLGQYFKKYDPKQQQESYSCASTSQDVPPSSISMSDIILEGTVDSSLVSVVSNYEEIPSNDDATDDVSKFLTSPCASSASQAGISREPEMRTREAGEGNFGDVSNDSAMNGDVATQVYKKFDFDHDYAPLGPLVSGQGVGNQVDNNMISTKGGGGHMNANIIAIVDEGGHVENNMMSSEDGDFGVYPMLTLDDCLVTTNEGETNRFLTNFTLDDMETISFIGDQNQEIDFVVDSNGIDISNSDLVETTSIGSGIDNNDDTIQSIDNCNIVVDNAIENTIQHIDTCNTVLGNTINSNRIDETGSVQSVDSCGMVIGSNIPREIHNSNGVGVDGNVMGVDNRGNSMTGSQVPSCNQKVVVQQVEQYPENLFINQNVISQIGVHTNHMGYICNSENSHTVENTSKKAVEGKKRDVKKGGVQLCVKTETYDLRRSKPRPLTATVKKRPEPLKPSISSNSATKHDKNSNVVSITTTEKTAIDPHVKKEIKKVVELKTETKNVTEVKIESRDALDISNGIEVETETQSIISKTSIKVKNGDTIKPIASSQTSDKQVNINDSNQTYSPQIYDKVKLSVRTAAANITYWTEYSSDEDEPKPKKRRKKKSGKQANKKLKKDDEQAKTVVSDNLETNGNLETVIVQDSSQTDLDSCSVNTPVNELKEDKTAVTGKRKYNKKGSGSGDGCRIPKSRVDTEVNVFSHFDRDNAAVLTSTPVKGSQCDVEEKPLDSQSKRQKTRYHNVGTVKKKTKIDVSPSISSFDRPEDPHDAVKKVSDSDELFDKLKGEKNVNKWVELEVIGDNKLKLINSKQLEADERTNTTSVMRSASMPCLKCSNQDSAFCYPRISTKHKERRRSKSLGCFPTTKPFTSLMRSASMPYLKCFIQDSAVKRSKSLICFTITKPVNVEYDFKILPLNLNKCGVGNHRENKHDNVSQNNVAVKNGSHKNVHQTNVAHQNGPQNNEPPKKNERHKNEAENNRSRQDRSQNNAAHQKEPSQTITAKESCSQETGNASGDSLWQKVERKVDSSYFITSPLFPANQKVPVSKTVVEDEDDWSEHVSTSGRIYYHNRKTNQSQWEKPKNWHRRENVNLAQKSPVARSSLVAQKSPVAQTPTVTPRPAVAERPTVAQRPHLTQRSHVPQKSPLTQTSPLSQTSPLLAQTPPLVQNDRTPQVAGSLRDQKDSVASPKYNAGYQKGGAPRSGFLPYKRAGEPHNKDSKNRYRSVTSHPYKAPFSQRGDWTEHVSTGGKKYYYNHKTKYSTWEVPKEWTEWRSDRSRSRDSGKYEEPDSHRGRTRRSTRSRK